MTLGLTKKYYSDDQVSELVDKTTKRILSLIEPEKIILFGSAAAGNFSDQSDLDFLIVMDDSEDNLKDAKRKIAKVSPIAHCPIDFVWFKKSDFNKKKSIGGVAMIANEEGRLLFKKGDEN